MKKLLCLMFLSSGAAFAGGSFGGGIGAVQNESNVFMLERADYDNVVLALSSKTLESFPVLVDDKESVDVFLVDGELVDASATRVFVPAK